MSYTMYTPLNVWLDPASVTDVVAYIQNYLSENTIYSEEEIEELIHDYLIAHPELIGGVQSVNGKTGTVVLSASDINTANNVTIESVLASLSSQISSIVASVATNTSNITNLTGRVSTAETDISNLKSNIDGTLITKAAFEKTSGFYNTTSAAIYKSDTLEIPAGTVLTSVIYEEADSSTQKVLWIIDENNVILDKISYTPTGAGLNTIPVNRSYSSDAFIGISGKGLRIQSVGTTQPTNYYSLGVWESYGVTLNIGQTLPFLHSAASNYYEFIVSIVTGADGINQRIENLEYSFNVDGMPIPRLSDTSENVVYYGRWFDKEIDGTTYKCTNTDGASIAVHVVGTTEITVDFETITAPVNTPFFAYSIDGATFVRQLITNKTITLPNTDEHFVWIVVDGMGEIDPAGSSKWAGTIGVYLKSITGGTGGTVNGVDFRAKNIYIVGDSIVEGINVLGTGANASVNSAVNGFAFKTARKLNSIPLLCGYGGTGVLIDSSFHKAIEAIEYNMNGVRVNSMKPDIVVIEYGANDGASIISGGTHTEAEFKTEYKKLIEAINIKYGCPIVCLVPFGLWLKNIIIECAADYDYCYSVDTTDWGVSTTDNTHPDVQGATIAAEKLSAEMIKIFGKSYFV